MFSPPTAYFLIVGLQILALWVPPFRGRALIFVPAIVACAIVLHSDRASDDPQTNYAYGMAWPFYLATIERLLFTTPELSFWRIGEKEGEAMSYGFGLQKLWWSLGQMFSPRGVGWNWRLKGVPRVEGKPEFRSRAAFVYHKTARFLVLLLGYDVLHTYLVSLDFGTVDGVYTSLRVLPFASRLATTAAAAYVMFCGIELNHLAASTTFVGLGLSRPEDWPPLYGDVWDAFTIRRIWGNFWHQLIRRSLNAYSNFVVKTLGLRDSKIGAVLHLFLVFTISGVFHAIPIRVMLGPEHGLPMGTVYFFLSQAVAVLLEEVAAAVYTRVVGGTFEPRLWHRWVGFAWVTAWLYLTLPFFLDDMFASGMMDASTIPFSVARAVAGRIGLELRS